jgi:polyferredoxin
VNKWTEWYDAQPEHIKQWMKRQPIWNDKDLYKATAIGIIIGFLVGVVVGYEWAWRPVVQTVKPLVG